MSTIDDTGGGLQGALQSVGRLGYRYPTIVLAIVLLATPFTFIGFTVLDIMAFLLAVIGLNVLVGFTGYLSFGQALYFGLGAYGTALTAAGWNLSLLPSLGVGILLGTGAAVAVGLLALRRRGIYFALLTLAFAQPVYIAANRLGDITGGTVGLTWDVPPISLGPLEVAISSNVSKFVLMFVVTLVLFRLAVQIVRSPFGQTMRAIRENEDRVAFLGYRPFHVKVIAFAIAGFYAATGGALFAVFNEFVFLSTLHWELSGDLLMMTLIGGIGTMIGPVVGTFIFIVLRDFLSLFLQRWLLILGAIFVLIVLLAPDGIVGTFNERFRDRFR
jgi:branched-chain amino acid transport system permease protein